MITTIIFDIGNVLVDFDWEPYIRSFGFSDEINKRIAKAMVLSDAWNEFDRGAMEEEEIISLFIRNDPAIEKEIRLLCEDIHDMLKQRDYAIPWIEKLKRNGYRVLYLSNFSKKAEQECAHALEFLPYTDGGIMSYQVKLIKPQPEIYDALIQKYGLIPEECVFLDDREDNCMAAEEKGIHAIVFKTKGEAEKELAKLGVMA